MCCFHGSQGTGRKSRKKVVRFHRYPQIIHQYLKTMETTTERKVNMLSLATKETVELIRKELTDVEIAKRREELSDNLIRMGELKDELKKLQDEIKAQMDPIKARNAELLTDIKLGFQDVRMVVANVPDEVKGIIEFYDENNNLVGSRKIMKGETKVMKF